MNLVVRLLLVTSEGSSPYTFSPLTHMLVIRRKKKSCVRHQYHRLFHYSMA